MVPGHATGEYRLIRQAGGRGAYAHVRVEVVLTGQGTDARVVWFVDAADSASAQPAGDPAVVRAALDGATAALADLDRLDVDTRGSTVRITLVGINIVDTEPTAVRAAAAAATAAAFRRGGPLRTHLRRRLAVSPANSLMINGVERRKLLATAGPLLRVTRRTVLGAGAGSCGGFSSGTATADGAATIAGSRRIWRRSRHVQSRGTSSWSRRPVVPGSGGEQDVEHDERRS